MSGNTSGGNRGHGGHAPGGGHAHSQARAQNNSFNGGNSQNRNHGGTGRDKHFDRERGVFHNRPQWKAVRQSEEDIPAFACSICGKPITDLSSAFNDRQAQGIVHFDCAMKQVAETETCG